MKMVQLLDAEWLLCHTTDIVTRYLLKFLYKHLATCAVLAIQKSMIDFNRKEA